MAERTDPPEFAEGRTILTRLDDLFTKALEDGGLTFEEETSLSRARETLTRENQRGQKVTISRGALKSEERQGPTRHGYHKYDIYFEPLATYPELPDGPELLRGEFNLFENGAVGLSGPKVEYPLDSRYKDLFVEGAFMGLFGDYNEVREVLNGII